LFYDEILRSRAADGPLDHCANFFVAGFLSNDVVAQQYATGVRVHHEHRMIAGIEQDGIGGFRANAIEVQ
jgi:hypothetical protein